MVTAWDWDSIQPSENVAADIISLDKTLSDIHYTVISILLLQYIKS